MRDEFTAKTREVLARRVAYHCSNPKCRKSLVGPSTENSSFVNIGVAAHITAASPGGPRYDASMSQEDRRAAFNGIYLCQNCAKLIDTDPGRYSVTTLQNWKVESENQALYELGCMEYSKKEKKRSGTETPINLLDIWLCKAVKLQIKIKSGTEIFNQPTRCIAL
jgi:hypothetical protein